MPSLAIKVLGEGTYGTVIETETPSGHRYAYKHYQRRGCSSAIRELSILRSISHPNVIHLHQIMMSQDSLIAKLELCDSTLKQYVELPRTYQDLVAKLHQILSVLDFLHQHSVVHGDLTPSNIFMLSGEVKVADFGATRPNETKGANTTTIYWKAPEAIVDRDHSTAIDMWSFGVIAFEVLTGEEFICDEDAGNMNTDQLDTMALVKVIDRIGCPKSCKYRSKGMPHPKRLDLSRYTIYSKEQQSQLLDLIHKCLDWDPSKRLSAKDALQHPLFSDLAKIEGRWSPGIIPRPWVERFSLEKKYPNLTPKELVMVNHLIQALEIQQDSRATIKQVETCIYITGGLLEARFSPDIRKLDHDNFVEIMQTLQYNCWIG